MRRFDPTIEFIDIRGRLWVSESSRLFIAFENRIAEKRGGYVRFDFPLIRDFCYHYGIWILLNLDDTLTLISSFTNLDDKIKNIRVAKMMIPNENIFLHDLEGIVHHCRFIDDMLKLIQTYWWDKCTHCDVATEDNWGIKYSLLTIDNETGTFSQNRFDINKRISSKCEGFSHYDSTGVKLLHRNAVVSQSGKIFFCVEDKLEYVTTEEGIVDIIYRNNLYHTLNDQGIVKKIEVNEGCVAETILYENEDKLDLIRFCDDYDQLYLQDNQGLIYKLGEKLELLNLPERSMHLYPVTKSVKSANNK